MQANTTNTDKIAVYNEWRQKQEQMYAPLLELKSPSAQIEFYHKLQLSGTMASVLFKCNPYTTELELYDNFYEPLDNAIERINANNKSIPLFLGRELEDSVAKYVCENYMWVGNGTTLTDPTRPWSVCQIDRCHDDRPFEIKTVAYNYKGDDGQRVWGDGCIFDGYNSITKVDDRVPRHYYLQLQKQIYMLDADCGYMCAYFKGNEIRIYKIERDDGVIAMLKAFEDSFLFDNLIPRVRPTGIEPLNETHDVDVLISNDDFDKAIEEYHKISDAMSALKKKKDALTANIKSSIGEKELVVSRQGNTLCKLTRYNRTDLDRERLKKEMPDLYGAYTKTSTLTKLTVL